MTSRPSKNRRSKSLAYVIDPEAIRRYRMMAVLTPAELAEKAGIHIQNVYNWQTGQRLRVSIKVARALAKAMNCKISDFAELRDEAAA